MFVIKRGGRKEEVHIDKITSRIHKLCYGLNMDFVEPLKITLTVIKGLYSGVTTVELDSLAAEIAASMTMDHPDYGILAARIEVSNLHKETKKQFTDVIELLYNKVDKKTGTRTSKISDEHYAIITENADRLNSCIIYDRDFSYNYFGLKTLEQLYLNKINGKTVERPQHMFMRVSVGIHGRDIDSVVETYNLLSEKYFMHAGATLLWAASAFPQLSSSYQIMMPDDSIEGIFNCVSKCALISKVTGEIGINIHNIRAKGTYIAGTNGVSNGLVPMLRVFNNTAQCIFQGGIKQPGALAIYVEPWHADILDFLSLKKPTGKDEIRARALSYALWIPDLFMKRVESNGTWSLMCPHVCSKLSDCWGDAFEELYEKYEAEGKFIKQLSAQKLWHAIIVSQMETGAPYMLYKDACNRKSNQMNMGTIKGGNMYGEILLYTSPSEVAVCNSASIAVNMFVKSDNSGYDFNKLKEVTKTVTRNLNKIIDLNIYPVSEAKVSSFKHRPISIGVQGLADAFILLRMPFDSPDARELNQQIFETLYYGALEASCELAEKEGPYPSYEGSPISKGILQYDMWNVTPSNIWDWKALKGKIALHGIRNCALLASMPTTSTAVIFGNNESVEPHMSNIYTRGDIPIVNHYLLKDLTDRGLWNDAMKNEILANHGSIQNISCIPDDLKDLYKTTWDISQKVVLNMAADRGAFIDQSQSLNIHIEKPNYGVLTSIHFYGWRKGLKTGMHCLNIKPTAKPTQYAVNGNKTTVKILENGVKDSVKTNRISEIDVEDVPLEIVDEEEKNLSAMVCSLRNPEACDMCGA